MPGTPTSRLSLPTIAEETDVFATYPVVSDGQMETLDNALIYLPPGPVMDLPEPSDVPSGSMYYANDVGIVFLAIGTGASASLWIQQQFSPGDFNTTGVAVPPNGWLLANGSTYSPSEYPFLYSAIGHTYGGTSSAPLLPDMRGRAPMGAGLGTAANASTWSLGETPTSGRGGEELHALLLGEIASHGHTVAARTAGITVGTGYASVEEAYAQMQASINITMSANNAVAPGFYWGAVNGTDAENYPVPVESGGYSAFGYGNTHGYAFDLLHDGQHDHGLSWTYSVSDNGHSHGDNGHTHGITDPGHTHSVGSTGSGTAHNNMPPVTVLNWFIKT